MWAPGHLEPNLDREPADRTCDLPGSVEGQGKRQVARRNLRRVRAEIGPELPDRAVKTFGKSWRDGAGIGKVPLGGINTSGKRSGFEEAEERA